MTKELWRYGALELASMIASQQTTSRAVVEAHLQRIEEVNPHLNAVVRVLGDTAREAATRADEAVTSGGRERLGRFHGVPFTVKENIDLAGTPTTSGLPAFAEAIAAIDSPTVERMRAAGAIPIGRTNLPDLGLRVHTDSSLHGLTRNPWHPNRTSGGSSGGEGSAIASGMSPLGLGNDIGGSLRNPAHCNGIVSIKPTVGVVPFATCNPPQDPTLAEQLMLVEGPMARSVADVRAALQVLAGQHARDPKSVPADLAANRADGPLRFAVMAAPPGGTTDDGIVAVVEQAGGYMEAAGHRRVDINPPSFEATCELWGRVLTADIRVMRPLLEIVMGPGGLAFLNATDSAFDEVDTAAIHAIHVERHALMRSWAEYFTDVDVLVLPTWATPAFDNGWDVAAPDNAMKVLELLRPVLPANVLGLPAVVVPGGLSAGMPVGVQIMSGAFRDLVCLGAAGAIEEAAGPLTPVDPRT